PAFALCLAAAVRTARAVRGGARAHRPSRFQDLRAVTMAADRDEAGERAAKQSPLIDTELEHLPPELRWREWMNRVEAVIFAASEPVTREVLARVVGRDCNLDLIVDDIRQELRGRPYDLVRVAGGYQHRTRPAFADAIRAAS